MAEPQVRRRGAVDDVVVAARDDRAVEGDERPRGERARLGIGDASPTGRSAQVEPLARPADGVDAVDEHRHAAVEDRAHLLGALDQVRVVGVEPDDVDADVLALGDAACSSTR